MIVNENIVLSNGVQIPKIGLGTWFINNDKIVDVIQQAVKLGYRHIDTAQAYGNEAGIGTAIKKCGVSRNELFITSKIAAEHKSYEDALNSIDESLQKMGLEYLDLMMIHSPQPWKDVNQSKNRYFEENKQVWRALEDALQMGKVRAIGVSNFLKEDIENLWDFAKVKPMVNQILCHISNTPMDFIEYCQSRGIVVESYSPVAHGEILKNTKIKKIAEKYKVSVPQLCIRYDIQLGTVVLPKTETVEHMRSNIKLDFEISEEDMLLLQSIDPIKDYGEYSRFPVFGGKKKD